MEDLLQHAVTQSRRFDLEVHAVVVLSGPVCGAIGCVAIDGGLPHTMTMPMLLVLIGHMHLTPEKGISPIPAPLFADAGAGALGGAAAGGAAEPADRARASISSRRPLFCPAVRRFGGGVASGAGPL
jgi:hypothetical protein